MACTRSSCRTWCCWLCLLIHFLRCFWREWRENGRGISKGDSLSFQNHFSKLSSNLKLAQKPSTYTYINRRVYVQCSDSWPSSLRLQLLCRPHLCNAIIPYNLTLWMSHNLHLVHWACGFCSVRMVFKINDFWKTNTKVITGNRRKQGNEAIRIPSNKRQVSQSGGKIPCTRCYWF